MGNVAKPGVAIKWVILFINQKSLNITGLEQNIAYYS